MVICIVIFSIPDSLLNCVVIILANVVIRMLIMMTVCKPNVVLFSLLFSSTANVSAMSHPKSGILLAGIAFLPSQVFPNCSSSYS